MASATFDDGVGHDVIQCSCVVPWHCGTLDRYLLRADSGKKEACPWSFAFLGFGPKQAGGGCGGQSATPLPVVRFMMPT